VSQAAESWSSPLPGRIQSRAVAVGVAALLLCGLGGIGSPGHFFRAWLVAYNFWLAIPLGCLVLLMLQYLTGGAWGMLLRRVLEAAVRTLPLLAVLFVPLLPGMSWLYRWAGSTELAMEPPFERQRLYLNVPFFVGRAIGYFVIWLLLAYFLNRWSAEQDQAAQPDSARRFRLLSGPGLVLYGATITFASIDWVMSLEPRWASTMYPVLFAVGQVLSGLAFASVVLLLLAERPPLAEMVGPTQRRDLGNLLLTFVMMWAYLSFSQFLLIWAANLPEEIPWYLRRTRAGWQWLAVVLVVLQFALPFLLLLSRDIKQNGRALAGVAGLVLALRFLDLFWWIEAAFPDSLPLACLLDVLALVGIGGVWVGYFIRLLNQRPLLPLHDPYRSEYLPEQRHE